MALRQITVLVGVLSLFIAQPAFSIGLGDIELNSALNEPLNAEIELLNIGDLADVEILVGLADKADFAKVKVSREFFLTNLKFTVDLNRGDPVIRVTSSKPIQEPYLDFLIELRWPSGRLVREYTLLMDLPVFVKKDQKSQVVESVSVESVSVESVSVESQSSEETTSVEVETTVTTVWEPDSISDDQYLVRGGRYPLEHFPKS